MPPTAQQDKIITHRGRPLVVVAAPGTGKTSTLVTRMILLLKEQPDREVVFFTFTKSSATDTSSRITDSLGTAVRLENPSGTLRTSTVHSYAKRIVHRFPRSTGRDSHFSVLYKREKDLILRELTSDSGIDDAHVSSIEAAIQMFRCKESWPTDTSFDENALRTLMTEFDTLLRFYNTFDFEGLVYAATSIVGNEFKPPEMFIHVDEYQDLNPMDQRLVDLAASHPKSEIVVVGHDAQSIYTFRHAQLERLRDLWKSDKWEKGPLTICHRLPQHILEASQALIKDRGYLGACEIPRSAENKQILTLACSTTAVQTQAIVSHIRLLLARETGASEKLRFKNVMVLTPSTTVERIGGALEEAGIPTRRSDRPDIEEPQWRLLLLLRMVRFEDSLALRQWLELAGMSQEQVRTLRRAAQRSGMRLYEYCRTKEDRSASDILLAVDRLREMVDDPRAFHETLLGFPSLQITDGGLREVGLDNTDQSRSLDSIMSKITDPQVPDTDAVLVTTMHSAKGLEAKHVLIANLMARFMPRADEEDRRKLYVAMTRAKNDVTLLHAKTFVEGRGMVLDPSPFLNDIRAHLSVQQINIEDVRRRRPDIFAVEAEADPPRTSRRKATPARSPRTPPS